MRMVNSYYRNCLCHDCSCVILLAIRALSLWIFVSVPIFAQGSGDAYSDEAARAGLLRYWGGTVDSFRSDRPTLLLATSVGHIVTCGTGSVNAAIEMAATMHLDLNIMVVVGADVAGDGLSVRSNYLARGVAEDTYRFLYRYFRAGESSPDAMLVFPDGSVAMHIRDLQRNLLDTVELRRVLLGNVAGTWSRWSIKDSIDMMRHLLAADTARRPNNGASAWTLAGIRPQPHASLAETTDDRIIDAVTPILDRKRGALSFIDPHRNVIRSFLIETGLPADVIQVDSALHFHFRRHDQNSVAWEMIARYSPFLAKLERIAAIDGERIVTFCTLTKPVDTRLKQINRVVAKVIFDRGSVTSVDLLKSQFDPLHRPSSLRNGDVVVAGISEQIAYEQYRRRKGKTTGAVSDDSLFLLADMHLDGRQSLLLSIKDLERAFGHAMKLSARGMVAVGDNEVIYYAEDGNKILVGITMRNNTIVDITPFKLGGIIGFDTSASIVDIVAGGGGKVCLLLQSDHGFVLQVYQADGHYLGERAILSANDELLSIQFLDVTERELFLLTKERKERWHVARLDIHQVR